MKTRPHTRQVPPDLVQRAVLQRERERREVEAGLVAVDCSRCGELLGVVAAGADCYCRPCQTWTPSLPGPKRGQA